MLKQVFSEFDFNKAREDARVVMETVFEQLKLPELNVLTAIEFNNRFTNRAGDANLYKSVRWSGLPGGPHNDSYKGKIRLGSKYFTVASEEDKIETVVHEACHVANKYLYYTDSHWRNWEYQALLEKKTEGHGPGWEKLMRKVGYEPNRYHCMPTGQFKNFYLYNCPRCNKQWKMTIHFGNKIINGDRGAICNNEKDGQKCNFIFRSSLFRKVSGAELTYGSV